MKNSEKNLLKAFESLFNGSSLKQFSTGGNLLSTLASFIPGAGQVISPVINAIDSERDAKIKMRELQPPIIKNINTEMLGAMFNGGDTKPVQSGVYTPTVTNKAPISNTTSSIIAKPNSIPQAPKLILRKGDSHSMHTKSKERFREMASGGSTRQFKQYDTGAHNVNQDQAINVQGNPTGVNPVATVQNNENAYTQKGNTFIYSDTLINPETGNTFNKDSQKLVKKYSNADQSIEEKNALDLTMNRLSIINDKMKGVAENIQMAQGGYLKQMFNGGNGGDNNPAVPPSENLMWEVQSINPPIVPTLYRPDNIQMPAETSSDASLIGDNTYAQDTTTFGNELIGGTQIDTPNIKKAPKLPFPNLGKNLNYNSAAMALKAVALGKSVADAIRPAEVESTILPDYRKSDKEMYSMNVDYTQSKQDALAASNLASNLNRSASSNFAQFQGRQSSNFANLGDSVGRLSMQENLQRNNQAAVRGQYEQGKAVDRANRDTQNRINNQQNAANSRFAGEKLFSEIADIGSQFNKYQYYKDAVKNNKELAQATANEMLTILGAKYTNFGFSENFMEKIKSGKATLDELVQFIATVDKK